MTVTVTGPSYAGATSNPSGVADRQGPARIVVSVERRRPDGISGDLGWIPAKEVADVVLVGTPPGSDGVASWSGPVTLPAPRGSQPFRLVIREFEQFQPGAQRLVYLDTVEV